MNTPVEKRPRQSQVSVHAPVGWLEKGEQWETECSVWKTECSVCRVPWPCPAVAATVTVRECDQ